MTDFGTLSPALLGELFPGEVARDELERREALLGEAVELDALTRREVDRLFAGEIARDERARRGAE